jgi:putative membrane protein
MSAGLERSVPRRHILQLWLLATVAVLAVAAGWTALSNRYGGDVNWDGWTFDPLIVAAAALIGVVYGLGASSGVASDSPLGRWRHLAFALGVGVVLLALESPLAGMAGHLFLARQMQDLLLRIVAPILILTAAPWATLLEGLPAGVRSRLPAQRSVGDDELRPDSLVQIAAATALSICVLYVWLIPALQDAAASNPFAALTLNATTFGAALLFWSCIFDFRRLPAGAGYGSRIMMLWIASLAHIMVGAYLTVKTEILYSAYGLTDRLFGINPLTDETVGGFIIWVPSALLCLAAAIMLIHLWGRHEDRVWAENSRWSSSNSAALLFPTTGEALVALARPKNRALATAVVAFVIGAFGMTILSGVLNHINNERGLAAHGPAMAQHLPRASEPNGR